MDIERLQTDAEYWRNQDPSNGEATHFEACYAGHECAWVRLDRKGQRHYWLNGGWVNAEINADHIGPIESMIPRPTEKPKVTSDDCLAAKIGGVGNQIHNLACAHQNDEELCQDLSSLACKLWDLAKEAPKQTVEWVDGLPPVGEVCQPKPPIWYSDARLRVLCHDEGAAVCRVMDGDKLGSLVQLEPNEIRPIQTPEEKKRSELIDIVGQRGSISDADIADAVLKWMEESKT